MRSTAAASDLLREGFITIEAEFDLPSGFPPEVEDEVQDELRDEAARGRGTGQARTDARHLPLVTLDPASSTDLDQAFAIAAEGSDLVLSYAIADVASVVPEGSALEREAWRRGSTVYLPHRRVSQYPPALSEGAASLLPDGDRPAILLTVVVDRDGRPVIRHVERAMVRSRAKLAYETTSPADVPLLAEFARRAQAADVRRGAQQVQPPEQEIVDAPGSPAGIALQFRGRLDSETANSALSLSANMAVASLFVDRRVGLFRDLAEPDEREIASLRRVAAGFGIEWARHEPLRDLLARLNPTDPRDAALQLAARRAGGGARYRMYEPIASGDIGPSARRGFGPAGEASASERPAERSVPDRPWHAAMAAPYAHATAPLRRLADRYVLDLAVLLCAGASPADTDLDRLAALPTTMERADALAARVDRACLDLVESVLLADRVGEAFDAVVVDANKDGASITIADPAIRARLPRSAAEPGDRIRVRLVEADPKARAVRFEPIV